MSHTCFFRYQFRRVKLVRTYHTRLEICTAPFSFPLVLSMSVAAFARALVYYTVIYACTFRTPLLSLFSSVFVRFRVHGRLLFLLRRTRHKTCSRVAAATAAAISHYIRATATVLVQHVIRVGGFSSPIVLLACFRLLAGLLACPLTCLLAGWLACLLTCLLSGLLVCLIACWRA